jgi:hypothetical protein
VFVELLILVAEYRRDWKDFKRGSIHSPEKPSLLVFGLGFLGAALVTVGVTGELRVHAKAGVIESKMRETSRKLVGLLQVRAKWLETQVASANSSAAVANERAAKAELRLEEVRQKTVARGVLLRMYSASIIQSLSTFPGQQFDITMVGRVIEQLEFDLALEGLLKSAGWSRGTRWCWPTMGWTPDFSGIELRVLEADKQTLRAAETLVKALDAAKVDAKLQRLKGHDPRCPANVIGIAVGMKP